MNIVCTLDAIKLSISYSFTVGRIRKKKTKKWNYFPTVRIQGFSRKIREIDLTWFETSTNVPGGLRLYTTNNAIAASSFVVVLQETGLKSEWFSVIRINKTLKTSLQIYPEPRQCAAQLLSMSNCGRRIIGRFRKTVASSEKRLFPCPPSPPNVFVQR